MNAAASLPEALARRNSWCPLCRERIRSGRHYIARVERLGWLHAGCAASYRRLLEENVEADQ